MAAPRFPTAYIVLEDDPRQRVEFQMFPQEIAETKAADWSNVAIIGRAEPYKVYASSGPRSFTFVLDFFASVEQGDDGDPSQVLRSLDFLRSLVYPQVTDDVVDTPPVCFLVIGSTINARVVATNYNITYQSPWEIPDFLPHRASCSITLEEVSLVPLTSSEVRSGTLR